MLLCYARTNLQQRSGILVRNLIALFMLLLPAAAGAADATSREVWHAVVAPPHNGLPTVTVDLGYPGPYISPRRSPITLRATAGDLPFDGYIGFHFVVNKARTFNVPVIARAVIRPHQVWSFTTEASLQYFGELKREIVIEWWDHLMRKELDGSAGIPPWSVQGQRLRVSPPGQSFSASREGDGDPKERADALPAVAGWYAGFRSILIPLALWLDLPTQVREAIFASGIRIMFSGPPKPGQTMNAIDRAILPVVFDPRPGSYEIPWPYRSAGSAPIAVPVSWKPKPGAASIGSEGLPYIVSNQVATWFAEEAAVNQTLPAMWPAPVQLRNGIPRSTLPPVSDVLRSFFPLIATIVIALMSVALWIMMRRSPRRVLALIAVAASAAILLGRDSIRPPGHSYNSRFEFPGKAKAAGAYTYTIHWPLAPGIIDNFTVEKIYGASPLPAKPASAEFQRTNLTLGGQDGNSQRIEIRDSATAPGWGVMLRRQAWDAISRTSERRELAEGPVVRVLQRDATKLVVEYESPIAVDRIFAEWTDGDTAYYGAVPASGGKRGTATIESGTAEWSLFDFAWQEFPIPAGVQGQREAMTKVTLYQKSRDGIEVVQWRDAFPGVGRKSGSFSVAGRLEPDANGTRSILLALPVAHIPSSATAIFGVPKSMGAGNATVSWSAGSIELSPTKREGEHWEFDVPYAIPPETFRQIVQTGGMLQVTVKPTREGDERAFIRVLEKKP